MAKIILNIPDNEFGVDIQNKFQDFFGRVKAEIETRVKSSDTLVCGAYEIETAEMFLNAFKEMQIIPKNATNGDMIRIMFPNYHAQVSITLKVVNLYYDGTEEYTGSWFRFDLEWWNAPYKRGNENEVN